MAQEAATIKLGVVGLSVASGLVLPAARAMPQVELVAGADLNPQTVAGFQERYGARGYASIEALCNDPDVNTVWVATPNQFHCPHVVIAAEHGKHVVTEKPFALSLEEADRMNETAERNGVHLLSGGSRSASPHVRRMREIVRIGGAGASAGDEHLGGAGVDAGAAASGRARGGARRRRGVPASAAPDRQHPAGGRRDDPERAGDDRAVDGAARHRARLLQRIHGVRGRDPGDYHLRRLRVFCGVGVLRAEQPGGEDGGSGGAGPNPEGAPGRGARTKWRRKMRRRRECTVRRRQGAPLRRGRGTPPTWGCW